VPWKRLLAFVGIYSLIVFGLYAVLKPSQILRSLPGLAFGASVALAIMVMLTKFGWEPTMLKSKADLAATRAEREAARAARKSSSGKDSGGSKDGAVAGDEAPRPKPAPTKRTTPGATNNPRRTRDTRKR
jgi:hypothetical protein